MGRTRRRRGPGAMRVPCRAPPPPTVVIGRRRRQDRVVLGSQRGASAETRPFGSPEVHRPYDAPVGETRFEVDARHRGSHDREPGAGGRGRALPGGAMPPWPWMAAHAGARPGAVGLAVAAGQRLGGGRSTASRGSARCGEPPPPRRRRRGCSARAGTTRWPAVCLSSWSTAWSSPRPRIVPTRSRHRREARAVPR